MRERPGNPPGRSSVHATRAPCRAAPIVDLYYYTSIIGQVPFIAIDPRDATPLYAQLERALRAAIATGRVQPGDQLPTVRQLAVDLSVNANTVARVYAELERAGVIETRRGVGSFVSATPGLALPPRDHARRLRAFVTRVLADADAAGFTAGDVIAALRAEADGQGDAVSVRRDAQGGRRVRV
jgi:GntR family transcriptional regulator